MAQSGRNAEMAASLSGMTLGDSMPTQTPGMQIDGGNIYRQSTDASKGGKDKGMPMPSINAAPTAASLSRGAEFTRSANARSIATNVTTPSPVAKTITPTFQSINKGPGNGMGTPRGGFGLYSAGNPFGQML
jgi:hypothetical protein